VARLRFPMGVMAFIAILLAAGAQPARAEQPSAASSDLRDARIERLQAQLQAEADQLRTLGEHLAAAEQADQDAGRTELMRKQIWEVLSEQEFRESLMPSLLQAGYDNGFFIRSSDGKFTLNVNGLAQFRWTYYEARARNRYLSPRLERDDRTGFDLNRLRLRLSGTVYDPDLTYAFEFEQDSPDGYNSVLSEAWANYRFIDEFQVKAGYFRPATTRMQLMDNGTMQFVDRSMVDAVFGAGYGMGVRLWGTAFNKRLEYYFDVLNSIADGETPATGRVITPDENRELDNNPALAFRTVWHALGADPTSDFVAEADLPRHDAPALDFGFHYLYNEDNGDVATTRIPFPRRSVLPGGFGLTNSNGLQLHQFGLDSAFKWRGLSVTGEYIVRVLDVRRADGPPYAPLYLLTNETSTTAQQGAYVQAGYFLPIPGFKDKLELVARVGGISTLASGQEGTWEYAAGVNYYIEGNKVKLQTDVTKVSEVPITAPYSSLANVNDDALVFRVQLQVAF
jgi:hypothetical protein